MLAPLPGVIVKLIVNAFWLRVGLIIEYTGPLKCYCLY